MMKVTIHRDTTAADPREQFDYLGEFFDAENDRHDNGLFAYHCPECGEDESYCECGSGLVEVVFSPNIMVAIQVERNHRSGELAIVSENPSPIRHQSYFYLTKERFKDEYGEDGLIENAMSALRGEIEELSNYMTGEVWGYTIEKAERCDCCGHTTYSEVDSCWGFYGSTEETAHLMVDNAGKEYRRDLLDAWARREY